MQFTRRQSFAFRLKTGEGRFWLMHALDAIRSNLRFLEKWRKVTDSGHEIRLLGLMLVTAKQ